jgi:hypothetical protein
MEPAVADEGRSTKMETQPPRSLGATYFITSWKKKHLARLTYIDRVCEPYQKQSNWWDSIGQWLANLRSIAVGTHLTPGIGKS